MLIGEAWGELTVADGYKAIVDLADLDRLSQYSWFAVKRKSGNIHVARKIGNETIWLHHDVWGSKPVMYDLDHENRNGLDNRKKNLRLLTRSQNALNSDRSDNAKIWERHGNKFRVRIFREGKRISLGSFNTQEEAEAVIAQFKANERK